MPLLFWREEWDFLCEALEGRDFLFGRKRGAGLREWVSGCWRDPLQMAVAPSCRPRMWRRPPESGPKAHQRKGPEALGTRGGRRRGAREAVGWRAEGAVRQAGWAASALWNARGVRSARAERVTCPPRCYSQHFPLSPPPTWEVPWQEGSLSFPHPC